ncbi:MAG: Bicarbonate transport ATP-binding protein CmpD [Alphaproteobacteria bacterium MarineAlpha5_Bin11]|nr:nitrate/sulfonate/bicarbonate ABC transporter ATP-binding protein [Pelagibacteraceae bacterium]PPR43427.1 MAG: Bicarbonate transport ATP-binding protein CmpD [Alphaproteobacteria bacterium MarineAlpha5_Bin11]|tara:strand:- start:1191 stop:2006 length:816 start_codon:yes stop_codon:yes gene_type:complete
MISELNKNNFNSTNSIIAELKNVTKIFYNRLPVIENLNLTIFKSDFLTLLGQSGCGKTTILKILCGLLRPTNGKVVWPTSTFTNSENNPANLSLVFQDPNLLPWLNVFDNVFLPLKLNNVTFQEASEPISHCLKLVGLYDYKDYFPNQLSGGMKMRTAIARALVTKPKVMLMDEPFGALDEITRFKLNNDLLKIYKKYDLTIIFVTHSVFESAYLSNKIAIISNTPGCLKEIINLSNNSRTDEYRLSTEYSNNCKYISKKLQKYSNENLNE